MIEDENGIKTLICQNENIINNNKICSNELNKNTLNNDLNDILMRNNNNMINNLKLMRNIKFANDNTRNKKTINLSQKRYEKYMYNHLYNNSNNNNQENSYINMSKKINNHVNKKLSLNEARYEKKIKNEKLEKKRDLSVELNHAHAEYFINSFKRMKLKQVGYEFSDSTNSNNYKSKNLLTQESQNIKNINNLNNLLDKNKNNINNQNVSINMEANCQIETKENDTTNFKTDQSKILKTDDVYQDLINSIRNVPFNKFNLK